MWIIKHRPQQFSEVVGLNGDIEALAKQPQMPHVLLHGPPGTGKTTTALIIAKQFKDGTLKLNSSDDRGIQTVREKIKVFAQTASASGGRKLIILDEVDALTHDAQTALRGIMEDYAKNCTFVLTANYPNKLIDPIKSRCISYEFKQPDKPQCVARLVQISEKEGLRIGLDVLTKIVDVQYPDLRSMVKQLELLSMKDVVTVDDVKPPHGYIEQVWKLMESGNFEVARQTIIDDCTDYDELLKALFDLVMEHDVSLQTKTITVHHIAECMKFVNTVAFPAILVESMMLKVMKEMGWMR